MLLILNYHHYTKAPAFASRGHINIKLATEVMHEGKGILETDQTEVFHPYLLQWCNLFRRNTSFPYREMSNKSWVSQIRDFSPSFHTSLCGFLQMLHVWAPAWLSGSSGFAVTWVLLHVLCSTPSCQVQCGSISTEEESCFSTSFLYNLFVEILCDW